MGAGMAWRMLGGRQAQQQSGCDGAFDKKASRNISLQRYRSMAHAAVQISAVCAVFLLLASCRAGSEQGQTQEQPSIKKDSKYQARLSRIRNNRFIEIWRGEKTDAHPGVVAVRPRGGDGDGLCSGVIVAKRKVMTARHCVCRGISHRVVFGPSIHDTNARSVNITGDYEAEYPCNAPYTFSDIAILTLAEDARVPEFRPAPTSRINRTDTVFAVGYGLTHLGARGEKNVAEIIIASHQCLGRTEIDGRTVNVSDYYGCAAGAEMVAADEDGEDTCDSDSGGPVFIKDADQFLVAGITSRPIRNATSQTADGKIKCGDGGIYVRLDGPNKSWLEGKGFIFNQ